MCKISAFFRSNDQESIASKIKDFNKSFKEILEGKVVLHEKIKHFRREVLESRKFKDAEKMKKAITKEAKATGLEVLLAKEADEEFKVPKKKKTPTLYYPSGEVNPITDFNELY